MGITQQVKFGNTGLKISPIIVGCMSYGSKDWHPWIIEDKNEVFKILKTAYDSGLRTFDTADGYSNGQSEILLGEFLKEYEIPRETVIIMTKVWAPVDSSLEGFQRTGPMNEDQKVHFANQQGLSRKHIIEACKNSVRRLGTYIDVYQIHRADQDTPMEETMRALNDVVQQGLTRYIGASSMLGTEFAEYQFIAEKNGWSKFVNMQDCYNLLYREEEREMIPYIKKHGIAQTPWSPLQRGLLSRPVEVSSYREDNDRVLKGRRLNQYEDFEIEIINRVEQVAVKKGITMAEVATAWLLSKGTFPILGLNSVQRVKEAIKALDVTLTEEECKYLEEPYRPKALIQ
ncbi:hypothetical protein TBLA_0G01120 [Henningerozyma blattae CBS 6284]|uniref:NADP-dependent oxidoreductase domain-containing protein n=1 Tax=Henningerozyma blattae (strain ATCC 34711 / CBS 6284 / DSM 70876 / NBRC 10599 / NRRL Y-10934 / UCD 77-7) TaxID=1071380 RepID=I2H6Q6_HENB6|nr:hypothetical protein TBLA_0G01120 [Tetrapisispora blattae CBS 6284]CCH62058.1 hypothetical protein TBLA_0G01120 [Tetrapisispora blattae CBS 6284]